ncbi:MAG: procyclic acidic repetitive family protein [Oscillospiraceae bacterium]|nr:procyclic acidic repetitive family protein [Oscillospiraceae bacterium]
MKIREINSRGSEIFPMMEKVRGVRHKKKLARVGSAAATSLLGVAGALLILLCSVVPPPGGRGRNGDSSPSNPPTNPPVVSVSPSAPTEPEPSTSPTPEPSASPTPEPSTSPTPEPSTSPTPEPSVAPYNPPYNPPVTTSPSPSPTPTPKSEPEISFSAVFYENLGHIALNVEITANDATDLETTINVMTNSEDSFGGTFSGEDSFTLNSETGNVEYAGDPWGVGGSMSYTLNGESKSDEISETVTPKTVTATLDETETTGEVNDDMIMTVSSSFVFDYSSDDVHDYDVKVSKVRLGWMSKDGENYTTTGDIVDVWVDDGGENPVHSVKDDAARTITFSYEGSMSVTPPDNAPGATHAYIAFIFDGTGTDKNTENYPDPAYAVFPLLKPDSLICTPIPLYPPGPEPSPPTVEVSGLYSWSAYGMPGTGLDAFALEYTVSENEADTGSIDYDIELASSTAGDSPFTGSELTATGSGLYWANDIGGMTFISSETKTWTPTFTLRYSLNGTAAQEEKSFDALTPQNFMPYYAVTYADGTATATFTKDSGDPMTYSGTAVTSVTVNWLNGSTHVGSQTIYPGAGTLTGSGTGDEDRVYTYSGYLSSLSPPSGATQYYLDFNTEGYGGTLGSASFTSTDSVPSSGDWQDVPSAPTGSYLGAGTATGIESGIVETDGFFADFPIDTSVVPDASDTTITPVSMILTLPGGGTVELLSNGDVEQYVVTDSAPVFRVRYEPSGAPLDEGAHTLTVTVSYSSGSVSDLRSTNSASFTVSAPAPDYGYGVSDPETWCDPPGDSVPVYTVLDVYYDMDSGYTYSATVTGAQLVWTIDGVAQAPVTLTPPTLTDDGEGTFSTGEVMYNVALPDHGDTWSYVLNFTVQVSGSNGTDSFSESSSVTSNTVTVKSPPEHTFSADALIISPFIGSGEFSANGQIMIAYNAETGFEYTATVTALEISFDGGGYETVPAANWEITGSDYSDPGYISLDYRIHGYPTSSAGGPCVVRFTVQISGVLGSDTYSTTLYPTASVDSVPVGT